MTREDLLEAIKKVEEQGQLGISEEGGCKYAQPNDLSINCVVGKLLTPFQREQADNHYADSAIESVNLTYGWFDQNFADYVLAPLQKMHDQSVDVEQFVKESTAFVKGLNDEVFN